MGKLYSVRLSPAERTRASELACDTNGSAQSRLRATVLLAAADGLSDEQIAVLHRTSVATVQRTRKKFATEGFRAAIERRSADRLRPPATAGSMVDRFSGWLAAFEEVGAGGIVVVGELATGRCLAHRGAANPEEVASAGAEILKSLARTLRKLGLKDQVEVIHGIYQSAFVLIRGAGSKPEVFAVVIIGRADGNLALTRQRLNTLGRAPVDQPVGRAQV